MQRDFATSHRRRRARAQVWGRPQARRRQSRRAPASWGSKTVTNAVKDILAGNVGALASKVESVLASTIPIVLDFLATLIGIGGKITDIIKKALKAVTQPIQDAIDAVLLAIKKAIGGLIARVLGGGETPSATQPAPKGPMTTDQIIEEVALKLQEPTKAKDPAAALEEKKQQADLLKQEFQPSAPEGKTLHIVFIDKTPEDVANDHGVDMEIGFSPRRKVHAATGDEEVGQPLRTTVIESASTIALADPLTRKGIGGGSPTSGQIEPPLGLARKLPSAGTLKARERRKAAGAVSKAGQFSIVYDRTHLIPNRLGGSGTDENNLVLTTRSLNASLRKLENDVFKALNAPAEKQNGDKLIDPESPKALLTKTFTYSVDTQKGPPGPPEHFTDPAPDPRTGTENPRNEGLRAAEAKLISSIVVTAQEIIDLPGGGTEPGKALFTKPVEHKLPQTFIPLPDSEIA